MEDNQWWLQTKSHNYNLKTSSFPTLFEQCFGTCFQSLFIYVQRRFAHIALDVILNFVKSIIFSPPYFLFAIMVDFFLS